MEMTFKFTTNGDKVTGAIVTPQGDMITSLLSLGILMILVNRNLRLEDRISLLSYKVQVNRDELLFLEHNYDRRETGNGFSAINPYLANDFDLFGNGSLYQYLNRCTTWLRFASRMEPRRPKYLQTSYKSSTTPSRWGITVR